MTSQMLLPGTSCYQEESASSAGSIRRFSYRYETNATTDPRNSIRAYDQSATVQEEIVHALPRRLQLLCEKATGQSFEDGMESEFSTDLIRCIREYGAHAIHELAYLLLHGGLDDEVATEALRQLGHVEHPASYTARLWLLEKSLLTSSSALVRDGALLGLALLDDTRAVPYLKRAIQQEQCPELRESIEQVLEQLENVD